MEKQVLTSSLELAAALSLATSPLLLEVTGVIKIHPSFKLVVTNKCPSLVLFSRLPTLLCKSSVATLHRQQEMGCITLRCKVE